MVKKTKNNKKSCTIKPYQIKPISPIKRTYNNILRNKRVILTSIAVILLSSVGTAALISTFLKNQKSKEDNTMIKDAENSTEQTEPDAESPAGLIADSETDKADSEPQQSTSQESAVTIEDDNQWKKDHNLLFHNNRYYEPFFGTNSSAQKYADTISQISNRLEGIKVYNMVIPTLSAFNVPTKRTDLSSSQTNNLNFISQAVRNSGAIPVNVYKALENHKDEYLYFNTDHHWTALAAYYCYREFAEIAGFTPIEIENLQRKTIDNFVGTYYNITKNSSIKQNPDHVDYYQIPGEQKCLLYQAKISEPREVQMLAEFASGGNAYSVFIWGDNPLMKINCENGSGRKIAVIKESYANAFVPFLAANYDEIHVIDLRHFNKDTEQYIKNNNIGEVLILNNIIAANTADRVKSLKSMFKIVN